MARKKTAQKSNKSSGFTSLQSILSNERTDFIFGLCFVAVSIFFVISFVSFLRTGQADQSILENLRPSEWRNENNVFSKTDSLCTPSDIFVDLPQTAFIGESTNAFFLNFKQKDFYKLKGDTFAPYVK